MSDLIISTLSLCRRAGKLCYGLDTVKHEIFRSKMKLVLTAKDVAGNTAEDIERTCAQYNVKLIKTGYIMDDFTAVVSKPTGVLGITDSGLAKSVESKF